MSEFCALVALIGQFTLKAAMISTQWAKSPKNFLTVCHYILSAELTKNALLQTVFGQFCPLGTFCVSSACAPKRIISLMEI